MKHIVPISAVLGLLLAPMSATAASSEWISSGATRMRIVVAEPQSGSRAVRAALQVDLAPGWKTYWQDPGDAGVPLELDLTGSQNLTLKAIAYPAPDRFDDGVTVWAGYQEPVQFALEMERGNANASSSLTANIFIGICEKICVPFQANLVVNFTDATSSNSDQVAVEAAFHALPKKADKEFGVISMARASGVLEIVTNLVDTAKTPELFLAGHNGWQFGVPKVKSSSAKTITFEASIYFQPEENAQPLVSVDYTLVSKSGAVSGVSSFMR